MGKILQSIGLQRRPGVIALANAKTERGRLVNLAKDLKVFNKYVAKTAVVADEAKIVITDGAGTIYRRANDILGRIIEIDKIHKKRGPPLAKLVREHVQNNESREDFKNLWKQYIQEKKLLTLERTLRSAIEEFRNTKTVRNLYQFFTLAEKIVWMEIAVLNSEIEKLAKAA
jgi:hypothetical protein